MLIKHKETGRLLVVSKTPRKKNLPHMNRAQRRELLYGGARRKNRLQHRIKELIQDIQGAGIKIPRAMAKVRGNRVKYLSGCFGQLRAFAQLSV